MIKNIIVALVMESSPVPKIASKIILSIEQNTPANAAPAKNYVV